MRQREVCLISKQRKCLSRAVVHSSERTLSFTSASADRATQKSFSKNQYALVSAVPGQIFVHLLARDVMMDVELSLAA